MFTLEQRYGIVTNRLTFAPAEKSVGVRRETYCEGQRTAESFSMMDKETARGLWRGLVGRRNSGWKRAD